MTQSWLKNTLPIAAIYSFRMLGLFMLIPVLTIYASNLQAATPILLGIALGSYGLSQGLLQIPFGMLSDRYGRKPILTLGLILFACGSLLGACTHSIYGMIIARTIQGTGAIGSVLIALLADLTPDKDRTKAMAVIGITIGMSFSLAMIMSPAVAHRFGLSGIFYLTTILATVGLLFLYVVIPNPTNEPFNQRTRTPFLHVLSNHHLQRLNAGIFFLHLMLTSTFFAIPLLLQQQLTIGHLSQQWHFYLPLMIGAFATMMPIIMLAERKQLVKPVFIGAVTLMCCSQFILAYTYESWLCMCVFVFCYFVAFNILEASLPSLVSRQASVDSKGTAMGIYSSSQFLGIFVGGAISGILYQYANYKGIFITNGMVGLIWLYIAYYMQPTNYLLTLIIPYKLLEKQQTISLENQLRTLPGVQHVAISHEKESIYLRVEKNKYNEGSAEKLIEYQTKNRRYIDDIK